MIKSIYSFWIFILFFSVFIGCFISCKKDSVMDYSFVTYLGSSKTNLADADFGNFYNLGFKSKPLMSTHFNNLEDFKSYISLTYDRDYSKMDSNECRNSSVSLCYISNGEKLTRSLTAGVSQGDLLKLYTADYFTKFKFVIANPDIIRRRRELEKVFALSRRITEMFGIGDIAFYDLAEASVRHINTPRLAYQNPRDSSEKGYLNTFNHVTAQAIMTSFFSEDLAIIIGDLHERYNMPELTTGKFSNSQLNDSLNNPVDNYVDIMNNVIGQKLGRRLKEKYKLNEIKVITPFLLASYLNDIQSYYTWALEIGLDNFRPTDELVIKFSNKMNILLNVP